MLLITIVAVGAAVAAWLRPPPNTSATTPPAPTYSDQQVAEAKSKVCAAFAKVQKASSSNSGRTGGDDPNGQLLIAVNMRQVFMSSSIYLLRTLSEEAATPAGLAADTKKLAELFQVITLDGLGADRNDPAHDSANVTALAIQGQCK